MVNQDDNEWDSSIDPFDMKEDEWALEEIETKMTSSFADTADKAQAWKDLLALTKDEDSEVRSEANYSLGRVYIFKATEADEENFRKELEKALEFFEKSSKGETFYDGFCLPFYMSFYTITFKKEDAEVEV